VSEVAKDSMDVGEMLDGLLGAFVGKHGEIELRFEEVELRWKGTPLGLEMNGALNLTIHLRELTDDEKKAHVRRNLGRIRKTAAGQ
jgi:hypothetical protein